MYHVNYAFQCLADAGVKFGGYAINTLPCGTNGDGKTQVICAALSFHFFKNFSGTSWYQISFWLGTVFLFCLYNRNICIKK